MLSINNLTPSYGVTNHKKQYGSTVDSNFFNALKTVPPTQTRPTNSQITTSTNNDKENSYLVSSHRKDKKILVGYKYPNNFEYKLEYSPNSTDDNPIIIARGISEKGNYFEQEIAINQVNPYHATMMEMHAFEAHYNLFDDLGTSSLPELPSPPTLSGTYNFVDILKRESSLMSGAGCHDWAKYYEQTLQSILDITSKYKKHTEKELDYLLSSHRRI